MHRGCVSRAGFGEQRSSDLQRVQGIPVRQLERGALDRRAGAPDPSVSCSSARSSPAARAPTASYGSAAAQRPDRRAAPVPRLRARRGARATARRRARAVGARRRRARTRSARRATARRRPRRAPAPRRRARATRDVNASSTACGVSSGLGRSRPQQRGRQRGSLHGRKRREFRVGDVVAQVDQRRADEQRLGLRRRGPQHPPAVARAAATDQRLESVRLADPGRALEHQSRRALTRRLRPRCVHGISRLGRMSAGTRRRDRRAPSGARHRRRRRSINRARSSAKLPPAGLPAVDDP